MNKEFGEKDCNPENLENLNLERRFKEKVDQCVNVKEIDVLCEEVPYWTVAYMVYRERRNQLAEAEAIRKATQCQVSEEAKSLWKDLEPKKFRPVEEKIYRERWIELANAEAPQKAAQCTISKEAWTLYGDAPNGVSASETYAKNIYRERWIEIAETEAYERTAECKTSKEAETLYKSSLYEGIALKIEIYKERWMELVEVEVRRKADECTTFKDVEIICENIPFENVAEKICEEWRDKFARKETEERVSRYKKEAEEKVSRCRTSKEVDALYSKEVYTFSNSKGGAFKESVVKKIYEKRWVELHLSESHLS